jgi:hypothetical protein
MPKKDAQAGLSCSKIDLPGKAAYLFQQERPFSNIACDLDVTSLKKTDLTSSGRHLSMTLEQKATMPKTELNLEMSTVCWVSPSLAWCMISTKT